MEAKAAPAESQHESPAESDREIKKIEHSGATLQVHLAVKVELPKLSVTELKRRADADRWNRGKTSGWDIQIAEDNMP